MTLAISPLEAVVIATPGFSPNGKGIWTPEKVKELYWAGDRFSKRRSGIYAPKPIKGKKKAKQIIRDSITLYFYAEGKDGKDEFVELTDRASKIDLEYAIQQLEEGKVRAIESNGLLYIPEADLFLPKGTILGASSKEYSNKVIDLTERLANKAAKFKLPAGIAAGLIIGAMLGAMLANSFISNYAYADEPTPTPVAVVAQENEDYNPGKLLVRFNPEADIGAVSTNYNILCSGLVNSINLNSCTTSIGEEKSLIDKLNSDSNVVYAELDKITRVKPEPVSSLYLPERSLPERVFDGLVGMLSNFGEYISNDTDFIVWQKAFMDRLGWSKAWYSLQQRGLFDEISKKEPITVAILDAGIPVNTKCPDEFSGRLMGGIDYVRGGVAIPPGGMDPSLISNYHGIKVASGFAITDNNQCIASAVGRFPVKIMDLRVIDANGLVRFSDVILALQYAAQNGAKVANMSFGTYVYSQSVEDIVNSVWNNYGLLMFAAAGNNGISTPSYPAALDNVIGVGKVKEDGTWGGSDTQQNVYIVAESGILVVDPAAQIGSNFFSGTSSTTLQGSAAAVYGLMAGKTPQEVRNLLKTTTKQNYGKPNPTKDSNLGWGQLDYYNLVIAMLGPEPTPTPPPTITPSPTPTITPTPVVTLTNIIYLPVVLKQWALGWYLQPAFYLISNGFSKN